jgi:hypothetical protein
VGFGTRLKNSKNQFKQNGAFKIAPLRNLKTK